MTTTTSTGDGRTVPAPEPAGRTLLDTATGVLVTHTGSDVATARRALLHTSHTYRVSPLRLARSVVDHSVGTVPASPSLEGDVVQVTWGRWRNAA